MKHCTSADQASWRNLAWYFVLLFVILHLSPWNDPSNNTTRTFTAETIILKRLPQEEEPPRHSPSKPRSNHSLDACSGEFFRYSDVRVRKENDGSQRNSHQVLYQALASNCQVVVGRNALYETKIMYWADEADPKPKLTKSYVNPGFYFTNETTKEQYNATAIQWGKLWQQSYGATNLFAVWDWPNKPQMLQGVKKWAPKAGLVNSHVLSPPCFYPQYTNQTPPWTATLQDKTVLIVHPFVDSFVANIPHLSQIWSKADPSVIGAPQSCFPLSADQVKFVRPPLPSGAPTKPWIDALEDIKRQIDDVGHFDIALLGCGGFGMPLVQYIAELPHRPSAMYIGGALQLFFGVLGGRWMSPDQRTTSIFQPLYNEFWTWPLESDIGNSTVGTIEDAAYIKPDYLSE